MKNVIFLGSKKIGLECLKILYKESEHLNYNVIGVLTNHRGTEIKQFCKLHEINLLNSLDDYLSLEVVDIAMSIQYHEILKKVHIEKAQEITINLHMAPLPEYRGCNQFSFAIIDEAEEFGTTIHRLEEGIDSGGIISEKRFKINKGIWVRELYDKTFNNSILLFKETLPKLINGNFKIMPQKKFLKYRTTSIHYRKDINDLKGINLLWSKEKIEKHIRATYMPGFEPPYFWIGDKKVFFNVENY